MAVFTVGCVLDFVSISMGKRPPSIVLLWTNYLLFVFHNVDYDRTSGFTVDGKNRSSYVKRFFFFKLKGPSFA